MTARQAKTAAPGSRWNALAAAVLLLGLGCGGSSASEPSTGVGGHKGTGGSPGLGGMGHPSGGAGGRSAAGTGGMGGGAAGRGGMLGAAGGSSAAGGRVGTGPGTGGAGGAAAGCALGIQALAPASFSIEAGPGVTMRVQGHAYGTTATLTWTWTVTYADGNGTQIPTKPYGVDGAPPGTVVEFPVENPGLYQIAASVTGDVRCSITTQVLTAVASTGLSFTFRTTTNLYPVQETSVMPSSQPGTMLPLSQGQSVALQPVDDTYGQLLPSYVRITGPTTSFDIEGDTTRTPLAAVLLPFVSYDVLIVPQGAFAPLLLSLNPTSSNWRPIVDPGIDVVAQTLAADDSPVANARLLLKRGSVPSTLATSDAAGLVRVQARAGSLTATFVPPDGSGLPVATTKDPFALTASGLPTLEMRWDAVAPGTLAVQVVGPDGATPVGNAAVWLSSLPSSQRAGVLGIGDSLTLEAQASVASSATTGDDGRATFPPFPAGNYALTIVPPGSAGPAAVTTVPTIVAVGAASQTITLASKVLLKGTLRPLPASAGALVRAVDVGTTAKDSAPATPTTGLSVSTQAASDGTFSLSVDPDRDYELILQPVPNSGTSVGRAVVKASSTSTTSNLGVITLPAGQLYQGTVMLTDTTTPRAVPNAFIQVYCASSAIGCVDPTVSLAEATSLGDGSFSLILPQSGASVASALLAK